MSKPKKQEVEVAKFMLKSFMFLCADVNAHFAEHKDLVTPAMAKGRELIRQMCLNSQLNFEKLSGKKHTSSKSKCKKSISLPLPYVLDIDCDNSFSANSDQAVVGKGFI
jgi:hypothetical protein